MMLKKLLSLVVTRPVWWSLHNYRVLSFEFGQFRSIRKREAIDKDEQPIPWYTYPAIEYIKQLDFSEKNIFEYGSGNSTRFWAQRCMSLVSVEDDERWYSLLRKDLLGNVEYHLMKDRTNYVASINKYRPFDVIIIDGSHRYDCARTAISRLKDDGFIILDNSDWREHTTQFLRESGLIQVDMSGFGPINPYTWTTSFFFTRGVNLRAKGRQPAHGIGSLPQTESDQAS